MSRQSSIFVFLLIATSLASGNKALDFLEGKDQSPEWDARAPGAPEYVSVRGENTGPQKGRTFDYSDRWTVNLAPLYIPYRDEDNPWVQEFSLSGLFEWRLEEGEISPDAASKTKIRTSGSRRARLGAMVKAFYNTEVEGRVLVDSDGDYEGVDTLRATVDLADNTSLSFGKFRPPFSLEYTQDPSVRWTPELAPLSRQIVPANTLGAVLGGSSGSWDWGLGYFGGKLDRSLPGLGGEGFLLTKLAYNVDGPATGEESERSSPNTFQRWHLDYIYNLDPGVSATIPLGYRHLLSTGVQVSSGHFDFMGDFLLANGDLNTAWGMTLWGRYWILEDAVRFVARYHYASTDDTNGLTLGFGIPNGATDATRPQAFPITMRGDELHSFYGGLNFHFFDNYLLLNTGIEYQLLENSDDPTMDLNSWFWQVGGRVAF